MCGLWSSSSRIAVVSVTTGSRELILRIPDAVTIAGRHTVPDPVTVPAGRSVRFLLPSGPSRVSVTAKRDSGPSPKATLTLPRCG
jgi:hypothetical protein